MIDECLNGYEDRANILGAYYLTISPFVYRKSFKEFNDLEFYNIIMQIMCFILESSLKDDKCFKKDIVNFVEELNENIYKKENINIEKLVEYILLKLRNDGTPFFYEFYDNKKKKVDSKRIQLIDDELIDIDNSKRLVYKLTLQGYNLLLSTKECGDLLKIKTRQIVAKLKLEKGDFVGTKEELIDINNMLLIQLQNIDRVSKNICNNIYSEIDEYKELMNDTYNILSEERIKYKELEEEILKHLKESRELFIQSFDDKIKEKLKIKMRQLNSVFVECKIIQSTAYKLQLRISKFRSEYDDILFNNLKLGLNKKYSFKEEILNKVNADITKLDKLTNLYSMLLNNNKVNLFNLEIPYMEQTIKGMVEDKSIEIEDDIVESESEKECINNYIYDLYKEFFNQLYLYGIKYSKFTLKEFMKNIIQYNKESYFKITQNANILRNVFMYLSEHNLKQINIVDIKKELKFMPQKKDMTINISLITNEILMENKEIATLFNGFSINELDETIKINTEINLETLDFKKLNTPNFEFNFY